MQNLYSALSNLRNITLRRLTKTSNRYILGEKSLNKRFVFTFFLEASSVLHFLVLTRRLFHRVAATSPKDLLLYITPHICGAVSNASDSDVQCRWSCSVESVTRKCKKCQNNGPFKPLLKTYLFDASFNSN